MAPTCDLYTTQQVREVQTLKASLSCSPFPESMMDKSKDCQPWGHILWMSQLWKQSPWVSR